jgi:hypothetical protein
MLVLATLSPPPTSSEPNTYRNLNTNLNTYTNLVHTTELYAGTMQQMADSGAAPATGERGASRSSLHLPAARSLPPGDADSQHARLEGAFVRDSTAPPCLPCQPLSHCCSRRRGLWQPAGLDGARRYRRAVELGCVWCASGSMVLLLHFCDATAVQTLGGAGAACFT